ASSTYAASPTFVWKWVRVTLKQNNSFTSQPTTGSTASASQVCWNGVNETTNCTSPNLPVYILTALAVTPSGSRRMIQAEIAEDRLNFTGPAALTMDGASLSASTANSNNYSIVGTDTAGCGGSAGTGSVPAVGVVTGTSSPLAGDVATFTNAIP